MSSSKIISHKGTRMKKSIPFLLMLLLSCPVYSQFTTEGFENWENGAPVNWFTSNLLNIYVPVTQSTDAHSGSFALRGETVPAQGSPGYPPLVSAGINARGFQINFRPAALNGWYKFHSDSGDAFTVSVALIKNGHAIGSGGYYNQENSDIYRQFSAELFYNTIETPDTIQIVILITGNTIRPGASFVVDDLSLGDPTDVANSPGTYTYSLEQNYPNPFNPVTTIGFEIPNENFVKLSVFNSIGEETAVLINETKSAGRYKYEFNALNQPSGLYFYKLQAGNYIQTRKMIVLK